MTMLPTSSYSWFDEPEEAPLPFTSFGQFGENGFDIRVLEQDEWWVNVHGEPFLLTKMSKDYLTNVRTMLFKQALTYHFFFIQKTMDEIISDYSAGKLNGDILNYELNGTTVADMPHEEWLETMPLVKRINMLLKD